MCQQRSTTGRGCKAPPRTHLTPICICVALRRFRYAQGKNKEADSLFLQAIEIVEETLGSDHPDVAAWLNDRAGLLTRQVRV